MTSPPIVSDHEVLEATTISTTIPELVLSHQFPTSLCELVSGVHDHLAMAEICGAAF
jgi:hypothetical protein